MITFSFAIATSLSKPLDNIKNKNYTKFSKWTLFKKDINNLIPTNDMIQLKFKEFKLEVLDNLSSSDYILFFFYLDSLMDNIIP
jgi:hypothetical protein